MKNEITIRYTEEMKDAVLVRMMPPNNESVKSINEDLGILAQSLCKWRNKASIDGNATPGNGRTSERWSSEISF